MVGKYLALATDGDGTLIRGGRMTRHTVAALHRWKAAGRRLILVTGETAEQLATFPHLELFDRIVAENGAVIVGPTGKVRRKLGEPPPRGLVEALRRAGVEARQGRIILRASSHEQKKVAGVLHQLQSDWQPVRNRRDLMIVPPGVSKASGLAAVLTDLRISPRHVVGIGDAENDRALLDCCGLGVAVNNAVPALKQKSNLVTCGKYGRGIAELIDGLLAEEADREANRSRPRSVTAARRRRPPRESRRKSA